MPFSPLPQPKNDAGDPRRTGVEIEFAGLNERQVCDVLTATLGGEARQTDSVKWQVTGTQIGDLEVYLDVFLRDAHQSMLRDAVLEAGRTVVPVEVVSPPLERQGLIALDRARAALCQAGAQGSRAGVLNGFGVHLNIEPTGLDLVDVFPPLLAFALCESWMRRQDQIDTTRRLLPWTDPYSPDLLDALVRLWPAAPIADLIDTYLEHAASRNHALDMLPLFAQIDRDRVIAKMGEDQAVRPTYHFRLPDCLIDDPDWSLDKGWRQWLFVEQIAAQPGLLDALCAAWLENRHENVLTRPDWADATSAVFDDHGVTA